MPPIQQTSVTDKQAPKAESKAAEQPTPYDIEPKPLKASRDPYRAAKSARIARTWPVSRTYRLDISGPCTAQSRPWLHARPGKVS